jgi:hypothetical protein
MKQEKDEKEKNQDAEEETDDEVTANDNFSMFDSSIKVNDHPTIKDTNYFNQV